MGTLISYLLFHRLVVPHRPCTREAHVGDGDGYVLVPPIEDPQGLSVLPSRIAIYA